MTKLYPFIQRSISELFFSDALLLSQCRFVAFSVFLSEILIINCKTLIMIVISNEKTHELTVYAKNVETSQYFSNKS